LEGSARTVKKMTTCVKIQGIEDGNVSPMGIYTATLVGLLMGWMWDDGTAIGYKDRVETPAHQGSCFNSPSPQSPVGKNEWPADRAGLHFL
jgi:hypothetical protein